MSEDLEPEKTRRNSPGHTLTEAISFLSQVERNLGRGPFSRDSMAEALGHALGSGPFSRKAGTLAHYGLLEKSGTAVRISKLGLSILRPLNPVERTKAVAQAAQSPVLYQELMARYAGQALPTMLGNILAREFAVHLNTSEEVAKTFRETMSAAGLLRSGILHTSPAPDLLDFAGYASNQTADAQSVATPAASDPTAKKTPGSEQNSGNASAQNDSKVDGTPDVSSSKALRRDVFALANGQVCVEWPTEMTPEELQDVEDWIDILLRKVRRSVSVPRA